jgi:hypothetical protein
MVSIWGWFSIGATQRCLAADCLQPPLRSGFRQQLKAGVSHLRLSEGGRIETMNEMPDWFPEPSIQDDGWALERESTADWLSRSTLNRAKEMRRFLNFNISQLPLSWQPILYRDFQRRDWDTVLFELFVGRTLQLLGASITVQDPIEATGKRPDFTTEFLDGSVTVEATTITTNATLRQQLRDNESLVQIIATLMPLDCSVAIWRLPRLSPNDAKHQFKAAVSRLLYAAVDEARQARSTVEVGEELESGEFWLTVYPQRLGTNGIVTHGMAGGADDTEHCIPRAFRRKKKQVRKSNLPVILALTPSPIGGDLEDFDKALFGRSYELHGFNNEIMEVGFHADGIFASKRPEQPTYAAALVYPTIGYRHVPDPVLYLNSRFSDLLPENLMKLRVQFLDEQGRIGIREPQLIGLLDAMQFVSNEV